MKSILVVIWLLIIPNVAYVPEIFINVLEQSPIDFSLFKSGLLSKRDCVYSGKETLNNFDAHEIRYFLGFDKVNEDFDYLQIAQKFTSKYDNVKLNKVSVYRLIEHPVPGNVGAEFIQKTKFRLRIYDVHTITGQPKNDLCTKVIDVQDRESEIVKINLNSYKVRIPAKSFFVAIEWLRIPYNQAEVALHKDMRSEDNLLQTNLEIDVRPCFQPIIGMSNKRSLENNTWALTENNEWVPYTHFAPKLTDFAISAEVEY